MERASRPVQRQERHVSGPRIRASVSTRGFGWNGAGTPFLPYFAEEDHPIKALGLDREHEPLHVGVAVRSAYTCQQCPNSCVPQQAFELGSELRVRGADQEWVVPQQAVGAADQIPGNLGMGRSFGAAVVLVMITTPPLDRAAYQWSPRTSCCKQCSRSDDAFPISLPCCRTGRCCRGRVFHGLHLTCLGTPPDSLRPFST